MLETIPSPAAMAELLGQPLFEVWQALCAAIDESYEMDRVWNTGGRDWTYEYKYRRGGKTLCCLYARNHCVGFMIIFGKAEREKLEEIRHIELINAIHSSAAVTSAAILFSTMAK